MGAITLRLPARSRIARVDDSDPLEYYYYPLIGSLFRRRLELGLQLLGNGRYQRILEIGYGSGILLPELARRARELYAVDLHRRGDLVRGMLNHERVTAHLAVGDVCQLGFASRSFDAIVCMSTLEHVHQVPRASAEIARLLRLDGVAIIGLPAAGRLMDLLFRLIGFGEVHEHHVSKREEVVQALVGPGAPLMLDGVCNLPHGVPRPWALYTVYRCRRMLSTVGSER